MEKERVKGNEKARRGSRAEPLISTHVVGIYKFSGDEQGTAVVGRQPPKIPIPE